MMFVKYEKTYRIPVPQIDVPGKSILSKDEVRLLLAGKVSIEEKIDGANAGIIRHKEGFSLQKRGSLVGQSEHAQFQFFHGWANNIKYDQIMSVPPGHLIYGELCYVVHTIYYDKLLDYFLVFDILNSRTGHWMSRVERDNFCHDFGFTPVPLITEGYFNLEDLWNLVPKKSAFGDTAEGIVVKRYRKKEYLRGKIVKPEFIKHMEEHEHWMHQELKKNLVRKQWKYQLDGFMNM
jgi:ATP-dependent RNA circularization protein (DNA/RNA ligase family)